MAKLGLIIPAAGSGARMGASIPKPFIELCGKPILRHSIEAFLGVEGLVQIVVATSSEYVEQVRGMLAMLPLNLAVHVVEGGAERQDSIRQALNVIAYDVDVVAIHDAVRPFVQTKHIELCVHAAEEYGASILAVPVKDTIKQVSDDSKIQGTPDRNSLWQAQTPQVFEIGLIKQAYDFAKQQGYLGTDDASLVENMGKPVHVIEGDRQNFKITYPLDLKLAELLLN